MPSSSLFTSKVSYARRQSSPNGHISIRCDDIDIDDAEISNALQRGCRRGLSMTAGESTGAANDVAISADDLVDVLLKESALSSAGGGHLMRSAGSPVIVGSSSPMFRRRRRSGVQLAEPLTVSRERTPSPRLAIFVSADDSISGSSTPEPVVESVSSKMTAKTTMTSRCDLEAPQDEQRRRRSADSTLASRSGSSDNLLASIQRAKDDARLMERQQSHIEEQKRRDHEARREERRRLSLQANRLLCSDVLQVPSSGQNSNCRQESIHRVSSDGSSQKICANSSDQRQVTVTSSSLNMTKNPLSETDSNKRSDENDACSSRLQIGVADSTSKPSSRQVASHDIMSSSNMHRESLRRHDGVMLDRADFADDSSKRPSHFQQTEADNRRAVHLSMLPCDDRGGSQSAVCSGSKSLKERFHCLSMMYASADNEDSFETAHNSRVSMSSVAPPPVNLTLTPLSPPSEIVSNAKTSSTYSDGVQEDCHDEGFESEHVSMSPSFTSQRNSVSSSTADVTSAADAGCNAGIGSAAAFSADANDNQKNNISGCYPDKNNQCDEVLGEMDVKDGAGSGGLTAVQSSSEGNSGRIVSTATKCGDSLTDSRIVTQQRQSHRLATVSSAACQRRDVQKQPIGRTALKTAIRSLSIRKPSASKCSLASLTSRRSAKTTTTPDVDTDPVTVPSRRTSNLGVVQSRRHVAMRSASQSVTGSRATTGKRKSTPRPCQLPIERSQVNNGTRSGTAKSETSFAAAAEPSAIESDNGSRSAELAVGRRSSKTDPIKGKSTVETNFPIRRTSTTSAESVTGKISTRRADRKLPGRPVRSTIKLDDSKVEITSSNDSSTSSADELSQSFVPLEFTDEPSPTVQTIQLASVNNKVITLTAKSSLATVDHSKQTNKWSDM
jgi:hypothetical protein